MARYQLSGTARSNLANIWRYYDDLEGELLANRQIARLHIRFELLADYPYLGRNRPEYAAGIRSFISPNPPYTILYSILEEKIEIAYVIHSSQNIGSLFEQSS